MGNLQQEMINIVRKPEAHRQRRKDIRHGVNQTERAIETNPDFSKQQNGIDS